MSRRLLLAALLTAAAPPADAARVLCYKTTSLMWDAAAGRAAPVSPEILERLHGAFRLWQRASAGALRLEYAGFSAPAIDGVGQLPSDGCVHAVLHGERSFHGELAHGNFNGSIPDGYKRGYFFVSRSPAALDAATLIHEIGHTLGLPHAAVPSSVMFSGPRPGGRGAPSALPDQDAADLRARWAPGSPGLYTVSGVIESGREHPMASVFAQNLEGGPSYSARSDPMGRFTVALLRPGRYRLAAKPIGFSRDLNPEALGGMRDSWYVSAGVSVPEPGQAAALALSDSARSIAGLRFKTLDLAPPAGTAAPSAPFPAPILGPRTGGGRPPLLRLSFDHGFDDEGPHRLKGAAKGDEVRLVPGVRGSALFVGGTQDWLDLALTTAAAFAFDRGFTLELWYRRDDWTNPYRGGSGWQTMASLAVDATLALTAPGCPMHKPWALEGSVSGKETGDMSRVYSAHGQPPRKWTHAALVFDPVEGSSTLYLDGRLIDRDKGAPVPRFKHRNLRLGTWHKANQAYRGELDEVDVYDFPRSAEEIAGAAAR